MTHTPYNEGPISPYGESSITWLHRQKEKETKDEG